VVGGLSAGGCGKKKIKKVGGYPRKMAQKIITRKEVVLKEAKGRGNVNLSVQNQKK